MAQGNELIRLAVFGSPIRQSLSPRIHGLFARQAGLAVDYRVSDFTDDLNSAADRSGRVVSARAFGHQGVGGQVAWGDPLSGISFCLLSNGMDANPLRSAHFCAAANNRAGLCLKSGV